MHSHRYTAFALLHTNYVYEPVRRLCDSQELPNGSHGTAAESALRRLFKERAVLRYKTRVQDASNALDH